MLPGQRTIGRRNGHGFDRHDESLVARSQAPDGWLGPRCTGQSLEDRHQLLGPLVARALGLEHAKKLLNQLGCENRYAELARGLTHQPQILLLEPDLERRREVAVDDLPAEVLKRPAVRRAAGERFVQLDDVEPGLCAEHERLARGEQVDGGQNLIAQLGRLTVPGRADVGDPSAHAREHRSRSLEGGCRAAHHDGQRAGDRTELRRPRRARRAIRSRGRRPRPTGARVTAGEIVDMSAMMRPACAPSKTPPEPCATASTSAESGTIVMIMSVAAAASAGDAGAFRAERDHLVHGRLSSGC